MATQTDVRRILLTLPGTVEGRDRFSFGVSHKGKVRGFAWVWLERIDPKKGRVPQPRVLALRTATLDDKELLLHLDPERLFTEPHYQNYPAVLARLPLFTPRELRPLLVEAWRTVAPRLVSDFRKLALALPGVVEGAHVGHPDFRLNGKVIASLDATGPGWGTVRLTPEDQEVVLRAGGKAVKPASGAWGRQGFTLFNLAEAEPRLVRGALRSAHEAASRPSQRKPVPRRRRS